MQDVRARSGFEASWALLLYAGPVVLMLSLIGAFLFSSVAALVPVNGISDSVVATVRSLYWHFWDEVVTDPFYSVAIPLVFLIQAFRPVQLGVSAFGASTRMDFLFAIQLFFLRLLLFAPYLVFLRYIYDQYFWYLTFDVVLELPGWAQFVMGYLIMDFLGWFHHLVRHKNIAFWEFHTIHHSQKNMNPFTNKRVHPFDWLFADSIKMMPAFMFMNSFDIVLGYTVLHGFLDAMNHSNLKTNFGWLRYILVTPQSHRVHHSVQKEHYDCNFGVALSIWDHLFGTQCRDYDVYPETGIPDAGYPSDDVTCVSGVAGSFARQFFYPFKRVWQQSVTICRR